METPSSKATSGLISKSLETAQEMQNQENSKEIQDLSAMILRAMDDPAYPETVCPSGGCPELRGLLMDVAEKAKEGDDSPEVKACVSKKIPILMEEGYEQKQAIAIAFSMCRKDSSAADKAMKDEGSADALLAKEGTSEGAKRGWETRRGGGGPAEEEPKGEKWDKGKAVEDVMGVITSKEGMPRGDLQGALEAQAVTALSAGAKDVGKKVDLDSKAGRDALMLYGNKLIEVNDNFQAGKIDEAGAKKEVHAILSYARDAGQGIADQAAEEARMAEKPEAQPPASERARQQHHQAATDILGQLGGRRLSLMTGARGMVAIPGKADMGGLQFSIPMAKGPKGGVNRVKVEVDPSDTYHVEFGRERAGKYTVVSAHEGIYNDQLMDLFEAETGLFLTMHPRKDLEPLQAATEALISKIGTSEGAKLGWETRRGGGGAEPKEGEPKTGRTDVKVPEDMQRDFRKLQASAISSAKEGKDIQVVTYRESADGKSREMNVVPAREYDPRAHGEMAFIAMPPEPKAPPMSDDDTKNMWDSGSRPQYAKFGVEAVKRTPIAGVGGRRVSTKEEVSNVMGAYPDPSPSGKRLFGASDRKATQNELDRWGQEEEKMGHDEARVRSIQRLIESSNKETDPKRAIKMAYALEDENVHDGALVYYNRAALLHAQSAKKCLELGDMLSKAGTSEGAKLGWEMRRGGASSEGAKAGLPSREQWDSMDADVGDVYEVAEQANRTVRDIDSYDEAMREEGRRPPRGVRSHPGEPAPEHPKVEAALGKMDSAAPKGARAAEGLKGVPGVDEAKRQRAEDRMRHWVKVGVSEREMPEYTEVAVDLANMLDSARADHDPKYLEGTMPKKDMPLSMNFGAQKLFLSKQDPEQFRHTKPEDVRPPRRSTLHDGELGLKMDAQKRLLAAEDFQPVRPLRTEPNPVATSLGRMIMPGWARKGGQVAPPSDVPKDKIVGDGLTEMFLPSRKNETKE